jgi:PPK2 family polyphosphate:nucleotide phosphotransferase
MKQYLVKPGEKRNLSHRDPNESGDFQGNKKQAKAETKDLQKKLRDLQEVLHAEHQHKVLVVLQGMDTSGKDGAIRHVFKKVNLQGVRVANFKVPTPQELDHDFLWRVHQKVPGRGELVIFNRSHYEDVLVVRVHELVPREVWEQRFGLINEFEKLLTKTGTTILKFFLYISPDEQKERLQDRLDEADKHWKFHQADLKERRRWPEYVQAYEQVLYKTSTELAPWYIVPANHKWYRNWLIATILVERLEQLGMRYPEPEEGLSGIAIE